MFWMRNKENNFPIRTLIWRPVWTQWISTCMVMGVELITRRAIVWRGGSGLGCLYGRGFFFLEIGTNDQANPDRGPVLLAQDICSYAEYLRVGFDAQNV